MFASSSAKLRQIQSHLNETLSLLQPHQRASDVTNNGRPMNASLSEDSVADTAVAKKNSDGKQSKSF